MKNIILFTLFCFNLCVCRAQRLLEVNHTYYTLHYSIDDKGPLYTEYWQTTAHTKVKQIDRSGYSSFHQDPMINDSLQVASNSEYLNNGHFDKGHLTPFTAMAFDSIAAHESMYYTNTAPQISFFNEHQWEAVEMYVLKKLSPVQDSILVFTGVIYGTSKMKDVKVPSWYWKLIKYKLDGVDKEEAWLGPNTDDNKSTDPKDIIKTPDQLKTFLLDLYPDIKFPF